MGYQHSRIIWASPERTWGVRREAGRRGTRVRKMERQQRLSRETQQEEGQEEHVLIGSEEEGKARERMESDGGAHL